MKSLDRKLAAMHADPHGCKEFIIADAKDADMAFGVAAPGEQWPTGDATDSPERHSDENVFRTLEEYREQIRQVIRQEVVDIVLMSASTNEQLAIREKLFERSPVTPAARANDATDVHAMRGSAIPAEPAQPFRSASLDHIQCGQLECSPTERQSGTNLGLYSVTFNNDLTLDTKTLTAFKEFREECEAKGFRYFLEVFNPNSARNLHPEQVPAFINDVIARSLAGVTEAGRPTFLKIVYQGPRAMEELVRYDPHLIVGILGGSAGTTRDAFQLIHDAQKYGAKVALFGRKINNSECQLAFIEFLRHITDGVIGPEEAVRAYHAVLEKLNIPPKRPLDQDLQQTVTEDDYAGRSSGRKRHSVPDRNGDAASSIPPLRQPSPDQFTDLNSAPDFSKMSSDERLAYHRARLNREFGSEEGPE